MTVSASKILRIAVLAGLCVAVAACSSSKKKFFIEENVGGRTKDVVETLPKGLKSDTEHANYSYDDLRGGDPE